MRKHVKRNLENGIAYVGGAGGIKGFGELGNLLFIEENKIDIGPCLGTSIGSLILAFWTNGYSAERIVDIMLEHINKPSIFQLVRALVPPLNPLRALAGGFLDLEGLMTDLVEKYELKPNPRLHIMAYHPGSLQPVIFSGKGYYLPKAITASCTVPFVMRPPVYRSRGKNGELWRPNSGRLHTGLLLDGGVHHLNPVEFFDGPCIVARVRFASELPNHFLDPLSLVFHLAEVVYGRLLDSFTAVQGNEHFVCDVGKPDVGGLSFFLPERVCHEMVDYGYEQTKQVLSPPLKQGRLPITA
jgi:hypothetical protein